MRTTKAIASANDAHSKVWTISSPSRDQPGRSPSAAAIVGVAELRSRSHVSIQPANQPRDRTEVRMSDSVGADGPARGAITRIGRARPPARAHGPLGDGTTTVFGLEELRVNCPCAECRGRREQGQPAWPRPGAPDAARGDGRRARGRLGHHAPLERRSHDRHLRVEPPPQLVEGPGPIAVTRACLEPPRHEDDPRAPDADRAQPDPPRLEAACRPVDPRAPDADRAAARPGASGGGVSLG